MSEDFCKCAHSEFDHQEFGCENCMCERFKWPITVRKRHD